MKLALRCDYVNVDFVKKKFAEIAASTGVKLEFLEWGAAKFLVSQEDLGEHYGAALDRFLPVQTQVWELVHTCCPIYARLRDDGEFFSERSLAILFQTERDEARAKLVEQTQVPVTQ